jgi:hypothetical protein
VPRDAPWAPLILIALLTVQAVVGSKTLFTLVSLRVLMPPAFDAVNLHRRRGGRRAGLAHGTIFLAPALGLVVLRIMWSRGTARAVGAQSDA